MAKDIRPLPSKSSNYWTRVGADVKHHAVKEPPKCDHYFDRTVGNEVECSKCNIGFYITPNEKIKDGHIYKDEQLLI